jgi:hypothetical protein
MSSAPPPVVAFCPSSADQAEVRAAVDDAERGDLTTMSADDFAKWMTTGEGGPWQGSSGSGTAT